MRKLASQRWKRNSGSWSELRCRGSDFPAMIWLNIRQTDTPQRSARSTPKPMIRRVNTSITTMTQWLRRSIDSSIPTVARCRYLTRLPAPMHLCEDLRIRHRQVGLRAFVGPSWTTDAPFRETVVAVEAARAKGILAVEMEAAALYTFARKQDV